jgi:hypothetical protein
MLEETSTRNTTSRPRLPGLKRAEIYGKLYQTIRHQDRFYQGFNELKYMEIISNNATSRSFLQELKRAEIYGKLYQTMRHQDRFYQG